MADHVDFRFIEAEKDTEDLYWPFEDFNDGVHEMAVTVCDDVMGMIEIVVEEIGLVDYEIYVQGSNSVPKVIDEDTEVKQITVREVGEDG